MKLLPLVGIPSFYAVQAVHKLMLGLKMLPNYFGESYASFYERIDQMSPEDQETMVREANAFVKLEREEILDIAKFCCDPNGVTYTETNINSLSPQQLHEMIVKVSMEVLKAHKIRLVTEAEKKN